MWAKSLVLRSQLSAQTTKGAAQIEPPPLPTSAPVGDFPLQQARVGTLRSAFDQMMKIDGQGVRPGAAIINRLFALISDRLYRVSRHPVVGA